MKQSIILNFIGFVAAFLNSTVIFFDNKERNWLRSGVIVAPDILVLPNDFVYQNLEAFAYLENYVHELAQNPQKFVKYKLLSHNFTKVNDATFVLKLNNGSKITTGNRKLRISRYPFCENTKNLSVVDFDYEGTLYSKKVEGYLCEDKNICANVSNNHINYIGSPLINTMDNKDYLIGLFDFNPDFKLLTQPCNILPHYDYCNYLLNSTAKITFCNALEMSRNLNKSGYSEVVLIGNAEIGNVRSFIPFGFGLIIGDREVIVFANDLKKIEAQIENYEIYGSGCNYGEKENCVSRDL
uniref:Uncharacterized protein n=1 Tax=Panagrolaimus davidi TaxID=227884 RepID=A0A914PHV1_9BILA